MEADALVNNSSQEAIFALMPLNALRKADWSFIRTDDAVKKLSPCFFAAYNKDTNICEIFIQSTKSN
jgi:hypothetical protein